MKNISGALPILALSLLTACGGGGSSAPGAVPSVPTPSPSGSPIITAPTSAPASAGTAALSVLIPTRGAASPSSSVAAVSEIAVQINTVNGVATVPSGVSAHTDYTISGGLTCSNPAPCSLTIPAPAGTLNYTITAYSSTSAIATQTQTVQSSGKAGQSFSFTLGGIVKTVNLTTPTITSGLATQIPLSITTSDATGALILDTPFANPVNFTDNDTSGATGLEIQGSGSGPLASVTMTYPSMQILFDYNGGTVSSAVSGGTVQLLKYTTPTYVIAPL